MFDYSGGIEIGVNEVEYLAALRGDYRRGLVVSLNRSCKGQFTLHNATCGTLFYDLEAKDSPTKQTRRSGKILFRDRTELNAWLDSQPDLSLADLNRCSRCM
jgi:hypothetical protein